MKARSLCMKYTDLLFFFAAKKKEWETYLSDLQLVAQVVGNARFQKIFASPVVSGRAKKKVLERLFKGSIREEILIFLGILAKKRRFFLIPQIVEAFALKVKKQQEILPVKLITVEKINAEEKRLLQEKLQAQYNKRVELNEEHSSKIIGGMVLLFPDHKILDHSLKARLEHLRKHLKKGKRHAA